MHWYIQHPLAPTLSSNKMFPNKKMISKENKPEIGTCNKCDGETAGIEWQPITDQPRPLVTMLNYTNPRTAKNTHMQPNPHMHRYIQMYEYMYVNIYIYIYTYILERKVNIFINLFCVWFALFFHELRQAGV